MGLDMYLNARRAYYGDTERKIVKFLEENNLGLGVPVVRAIEFEVGYWRKANHIHAWFVKHVQEGKDDCGDYLVSSDDLQELMKVCEAVVEKKCPVFSEAILPTQSGFFFGGTGYDEYYYEDCEHTIEICKKVLALWDKPEIWFDVYYHSSW